MIDLKREVRINRVHSRFLQDSRAWILMPSRVEYYTSDDNVNFTLVKTVSNTKEPKDNGVQIADFAADFASITAKYVKVKAYNFGKLPEWHQGAGGDDQGHAHAFRAVDDCRLQ